LTTREIVCPKAPGKKANLDTRVSIWLPEVFVVLALLLGLCYALILPPLQVPDEFGHMYRADGLSQGHFTGSVLTAVPQSIERLTSRFPLHLEAARRVTASELLDAAREPLNPAAISNVPNEGVNLNMWIPYLPSAAVILVARLLHAPALVILYLARIANLAGYISLTWLALRILPAYRVLLFTIALMPMTLHQAAGLSWDSIAFALGFFFCALVIRHSCPPLIPLANREYAVLFGSAVIVGLCKVDAALLLLLLLIPAPRFPSRRRQMLFLGTCVAGSVAATMIWQYANRANLLLFKLQIVRDSQTNFPDNIWYLYYNTGFFLNALGRSIVHTGSIHLAEFVGVFGWLFARLPVWAVLLYLVALVCAGITSTGLQLSWLQRGVLFAAAALGCLACVLAMWLITPNFFIQQDVLHNRGTFWGIQGRHFIPFAFPGLAFLSNRYFRVGLFWRVVSITIVVIAVNAAGILSIKRSYYLAQPQAEHARIPDRHVPNFAYCPQPGTLASALSMKSIEEYNRPETQRKNVAPQLRIRRLPSAGRVPSPPAGRHENRQPFSLQSVA
jgi:uncharacterized membrane protein